MADGNVATILVVEDDDAMRDLLVEELRDAGHRVLSAPGGRLGLDVARAEPPDVVVTDLRMPDLDGFDLIRDLSALPESPHIVMITAFGSIETAIKAVKLGAYDYITKPFEIDELLLLIDKAVGERILRRQVALVTRIAGSTASVLITGESGTGKELIARAIHYNSPRARGPFVAVNLAAVPGPLLESELFGHKKGAFTDARADRDERAAGPRLSLIHI